jgi:hypothetical protein
MAYEATIPRKHLLGPDDAVRLAVQAAAGNGIFVAGDRRPKTYD